MEGLTERRDLVRRAICSLNDCLPVDPMGDVETLFLCDVDAGLFQLMNLGWQGKKRTCSITLLVRVKDQTVWIEEDWTEDGFAGRLVAMGVPRDEIVLAFHPPHLRPLTDFASGEPGLSESRA